MNYKSMPTARYSSLFRCGFVAILALLFVPACANLNPDYEQPTVTISSFNAIPSEGMVPAFEIGLRIINPNSSDLKLEGIVYTVALQGYELVKGVGRDFPVIPGYSEGEVKLTASANLLAGIRFIGDMMNTQDDRLNYQFDAKLDLGGLYPTIRVQESGEYLLNNSR